MPHQKLKDPLQRDQCRPCRRRCLGGLFSGWFYYATPVSIRAADRDFDLQSSQGNVR
jgi:hypothetical protein